MLATLLSGCQNKCIKGHYETRHHEQFEYFIYIDDVPMLQFMPAYDSQDFICDERSK